MVNEFGVMAEQLSTSVVAILAMYGMGSAIFKQAKKTAGNATSYICKVYVTACKHLHSVVVHAY